MTLDKLQHRPVGHRGEDTRRRILETAIEVFAEAGYEGATTRLLAERAGVNLPAIQYYFGSKEGLYRAAVAHIVEHIEGRTAEPAARIEEALADDPSPSVLLALLNELLDAFVALVVGGQEPESWGLFLSRAEIENSAVLAPLNDSILRQTIRPCAALIGRFIERPAEDEITLLRTLTILGQVTIFHKRCAHQGLKEALGYDEFSEANIGTIQALVREQATAILTAARRGQP